jgi:hypothetical protein
MPLERLGDNADPWSANENKSARFEGDFGLFGGVVYEGIGEVSFAASSSGIFSVCEGETAATVPAGGGLAGRSTPNGGPNTASLLSACLMDGGIGDLARGDDGVLA